MYTEHEYLYRESIREKLANLRQYLDDQTLDAGGAASDWYRHLAQIKSILGNLNNDVSFVATLLAKSFLVARFGEIDFDAAENPQGAPGLDIDVTTVGGTRFVAEIKTTTPYNDPDFGAQQKASFERDFAKLAAAEADHKFMFVTETKSFDILCRPSYASKLTGVTVVQLTSGAELQAG